MNLMGVMFAVVLSGLAVAVGVSTVLDRRRTRRFVQATAARWLAEGRDMRFYPTPAGYYGNEPLRSHARVAAEEGVLGIADRQLIFIPFKTGREQAISFDLIQWIGTHSIEVGSGDGTISRNALVVHYEAMGKWCMCAWTMDWPDNIAEVLAKLAGQTFHKCLDHRDDYGPYEAECLLQDVYGEWHPVPEARRQAGVANSPFAAVIVSEGPLYLAPDRLIFNRHHMLHLSRLRRIEVYERGGLLNHLNPFAKDLLRIEYALPDDPRAQVVGFLLPQAEQYAKLLAWRTQVPFEMREGRKKKEDE